jgi:hypothetical protein
MRRVRWEVQEGLEVRDALRPRCRGLAGPSPHARRINRRAENEEIMRRGEPGRIAGAGSGRDAGIWERIRGVDTRPSSGAHTGRRSRIAASRRPG